MSNSLKKISAYTVPVADTADYNAIKPYKFTEATTNPIIIFQTSTSPQYKHHIQKSAEYGFNTGITLEEKIENALDMVNVSLGEEILQVVTSRVHVQIDPRLAFDTKKSINRALKIVKMFEDRCVDKKKVVIKLPVTWEGIQAAKELESVHEIKCNMTTMFSLTQAALCADAKVSYLAPFVGLINLWYEKKSRKINNAYNHEGVKVLKLIQAYMKKFGYKTKVMGAYFVNVEEVKAVTGCDLATLPTKLIKELFIDEGQVTNNMDCKNSDLPIDKIHLTEDEFRWMMNNDEMASDLLSEMIRVFTDEFIKLENIVKRAVLSVRK